MSNLGKQIVFRELLERHGCVQIPMIQRDYAQGRESEQEVRDEFLDALHGALLLPEEDRSLPLNLDFIYGSVEGGAESKFLPLDGQQRLTTLFLLHWYLSWRDGCWDEFRQIFSLDGTSRFSYSVRPSSEEFFDALVEFSPELDPDTVNSLSDLLGDQPWYFRYWRLDPTIQSSLTMLDAIHLRFKETKGLFSRITDVEKPAITFQFLDMENFGLSDDLYIKMNSRGKPLTPFETFKARFEQELEVLFGDETRKVGGEELSISEYFSRRMDTLWADFLWPYRDKDTHIFDDAVMNLFRAVILATRHPEDESFIRDIPLLRNKWQKSSYSFFHKRGWLDRSFVEVLITLLEAWGGSGHGFVLQLPNAMYFDEKAVFLKAVKEPASFGYEEIVQLAGYSLYIREYNGLIVPEEFQEWMRIVFNLSVNTDYNRPPDLRRSLSGLIKLAPHMRDILSHFAASEKPVAGFSSEQILEEKLKAQLIVGLPDWRPLIDQAEGHGYFRGQIEFLLSFSGVREKLETESISDWDEDTHRNLKEAFCNYLKKAESMFSSRGLNDLGDYRWERALLCIDDYLLKSRRNYSFLANAQAEQASWKRLLRGVSNEEFESRAILHKLWERLKGTENIEGQLDAIISETSGLDPWIDAFVRTPAAVGYCGQRMIRWYDDDEVYLLNRVQMNGMHAELFTYCFYQNRLKELDAEGSLAPLKLGGYESVNCTDYEPWISIQYNHDGVWLDFEIEFGEGEFHIDITCDQVTSFPEVEKALGESLGFVKNGTYYRVSAGPDKIEGTLLGLAKIEKLIT